MRKCRIAVFVATASPLHCAIGRALYQTVNTPCYKNDYDVEICNTSLFNMDAIEADLKKVMNEHDVIVTIGQNVTLTVNDYVSRQDKFFPVIFTAIHDPVYLKLVPSLDSSSRFMTGVWREPGGPLDAARYLVKLKPYLKRVLLPYDPYGEGGTLPKKTSNISSFFNENGIEVLTLPLVTHREVVSLIREHVRLVDCVYFVEGSCTAASIRHISYICWQNDKLLCGETVDSIDLGAACAYAGNLNLFAEKAFSQIRLYWEERCPISELSVITIPNNRRFIINMPRMPQAGVPYEALKQFENDPNVSLVRRWVNMPIASEIDDEEEELFS